jgi:hypothetical protein
MKTETIEFSIQTPDPHTVSLAKVHEERAKAEAAIRDALAAFWAATGVQPRAVDIGCQTEQTQFLDRRDVQVIDRQVFVSMPLSI